MYRVDRKGKQPDQSRLYGGLSGSVARMIDSVLSPIAPRFVLSRQKARAGSAALFNYDAAVSKRTRRDLRASSADQDLLIDLPKMRENSRAMCRDDGSAAAMVKVLEDNVVGTGMQPQMVVDPAVTGLTDAQVDKWNRGCEQLFRNWAESDADASENDSFEDLQRQVLRALVVDGEALLHRTYVDPAQQIGRELGTAFELIDADRLMDPPGTNADIRAGVEVGDRQQAIAYHITPRHPDDSNRRWRSTELQRNHPRRWARFAGGQLSVLHVFRRDRASQTRGVPFFAPCFGLVEAMNDMLSTELTAARAASKFCAFIKQSIDVNNPTFSQQPEGDWYEKLEEGTIRYLSDGEELQPYTPNRPGSSFEPFVVRVLRSICGALNLPYELVLKDFGRMNYSSARVALLEARRGFEVLQQLLVQKLCQPVLRAVIMDGVVSGVLPMPRGFLSRPAAFMRAYWQPPAWGWVDPVKEIEASRMAIENNLSTPQAEAARQGADAEMNLELRGRFLKRARDVEQRYGLTEGTLTATGSAAAPQPAAKPEAEEEDAEAKEEEEEEEETEEQPA